MNELGQMFASSTDYGGTFHAITISFYCTCRPVLLVVFKIIVNSNYDTNNSETYFTLACTDLQKFKGQIIHYILPKFPMGWQPYCICKYPMTSPCKSDTGGVI